MLRGHFLLVRTFAGLWNKQDSFLTTMGRSSIPNFLRLLLLIFLLFLLYTVISYDLSTGGEFKSWLTPQPILALLGLIVGFIALSWQLEMQHQNTLEANRKQAQDRLRLEIYQQVAVRIEATTAPLSSLANLPFAFEVELKRRVGTTVGRKPNRRSEYSFRILQEAVKRVHDAVIKLIAILEIYEIVMPEFAIFRRRLSEQLSSLRDNFGKFVSEAVWFTESGSLGPIKWPPTAADFKLLEELGRPVSEISMDLTGSIWDLRVEAQNYLLGGIFPERRVPTRTPGDASVVVTTVRTDQG